MAGVRKEGVTRAWQQLGQLESDGRGERVPFTMNDERGDGKGTQTFTPVIPLAPQTCHDCGARHTLRVRRSEVRRSASIPAEMPVAGLSRTGAESTRWIPVPSDKLGFFARHADAVRKAFGVLIGRPAKLKSSSS